MVFDNKSSVWWELKKIYMNKDLLIFSHFQPLNFRRMILIVPFIVESSYVI